MVRTKLELMEVDSGGRSVAVTSCDRGEGESVGIANPAVTMALVGKKVVLVDAALRRPSQHTFFRITSEVGVSTVAAGRSALTDSLVPVKLQADGSPGHEDHAACAAGVESQPRLYVLPSGSLPPNPGETLA